ARERPLTGRIEEQDSGNRVSGESFERVGGTGEVVAVVTEQPAAHSNFCSASRNSGWSFAYSSAGIPATAASQACRRLRTPAPQPPGCAITPPPAAKIRSVAPIARYVSCACFAD